MGYAIIAARPVAASSFADLVKVIECMVKYIFIMCRVSAKTEFRRWRPHAALG
jgi:hypothetical protein